MSAWLAELEKMCRTRQRRAAKLMRLTLFTVVLQGGRDFLLLHELESDSGEGFGAEMGSDVPFQNFK